MSENTILAIIASALFNRVFLGSMVIVPRAIIKTRNLMILV